MNIFDFLAHVQNCGFVSVFEEKFTSNANFGGKIRNNEKFYIYWHESKGLLLEISAIEDKVDNCMLYFNYAPEYLISVTRPCHADYSISAERRCIHPKTDFAAEINAIEKNGRFVTPWVGAYNGYDWLLHWRESNNFGKVWERPLNYTNRQVREKSLARLKSLPCYDQIKGYSDDEYTENLKTQIFEKIEAVMPNDRNNYSGMYVADKDDNLPHIAYVFVFGSNRIRQIYPFSNFKFAIEKFKKLMSWYNEGEITNWDILTNEEIMLAFYKNHGHSANV